MLKFRSIVESWEDDVLCDTFETYDSVTVHLLNGAQVDGIICGITEDSIIVDVNYPAEEYEIFRFKTIDHLEES